MNSQLSPRRGALRMFIVLFSLGSLAACGDGDGPASDEHLTCDRLDDPTFCWPTLARSFADCFPEDADVVSAVFEADRQTCTFSDGTTVVFAEPLPYSAYDPELPRIAFEIFKDGSRCGHFEDFLDNRAEFSAGDQEVSARLYDSDDFEVLCPDGESFVANFDDLFECPVKGIPLPSPGLEFDTDFVRFEIPSVNTRGNIFRCETE